MSAIEVKRSDPFREKLLYLFAMLFVLMFTGVIVLSVLLATRPSKLESTLCTTSTCIRSANLILTNIDETVDPCENFYEFSCGNFDRNNRIDESQSKVNHFTMLNDELSYTISDILSEPKNDLDMLATINAKHLFASCMNEDIIEQRGLEPLLKYIRKELSGWPILNETIITDNRNDSMQMLDKIIQLKKIESSQLFELFVSTDPKNPKKNVIRVLQPSWLFNRKYLQDKEVMDAYKTLMTTVIQYFVPDQNISETIEQMLIIEHKFSNIQIDTELRRNSSYSNFTLDELAMKIPEFDWKYFLRNGIFKDQENINITDGEIILVDDFEYVKEACKIYQELVKTNKKDFENLLIWILVKDYIGYLPKKFQTASLKFDKVFHGTSISPKRRLLCSNMVSNKMEDAVGRLYVSKYFDKNAKKDAMNMVTNILNEFKEILKESDWMDENSKQKAIEKATLIDIKIGYSEQIYNDTRLNEQYKLNYNSTEFLENHYTSIESAVFKAFESLRKEIDPKEWISGAAVVNAFYSPPSNQICFPAGILQQPFYDAQNPKYLNYGGIGMVIGHEITHGFDDVGRLYDKHGVYFSDDEGESLWTNKTVQNYIEKVQCIIDQYNSYIVTQVNQTINGLNTQGENIADNGGLKQSFRAYKKWAKSQPKPELLLPGLDKYTQDQLFFINYGMQWCGIYRDQALKNAIVSDSHSPGEFRVIGSTSNFEEFAETFKCRAGQMNNPSEKCSVW